MTDLLPARVSRTVGDAVETARAYLLLQTSGFIDLRNPARVLRAVKGNRTIGPATTMIKKSAEQWPDSPAVTDERGTFTFRELDDASDRLANALLASGLKEGDVVGMLARDHRGLVLTIAAAGKAGLRLAMMNTGFAKPQFGEVAKRERVQAMLHDSEFVGLLDALPADMPRFLTWVDEGDELPEGSVTIEELIERGAATPPPTPAKAGGFIILTSGTTGLPKGAPRTKVDPTTSAVFLDRLPIPTHSTVAVASPLFHATGFALWTVATSMGNETVTMRRFDPENTLRLIDEHRVELLVAVPTMLSRILALGPETIGRYDTSSLNGIVVAGSALAPELAERVQDTFGDVLYNLYGSTEVAVAAVAKPDELRRAPGTVGRPPITSHVALFDADGHRITEPETKGRVFVRAGAAFEGYTDGRTKEVLDGYMSSGDMGHFDAEGLLFIDGRDDDMIVSGGENVYPLEVENLLAAHPEVLDVAVIGVEDPEFGARLRALVVRTDGSGLDRDAVREHVRENLARYKVPRDVVFVDELPRNPTGKLIRKQLHEIEAD
ncbi:acyl-CoA synthetase [Tsukamurella sp. 8F]|uniref:acyl-CoA synthetase n=1 Tax=unclassified Tsukamurella TaxID=2633480 RepID=UPI0023B96299|nr:MULTISPECIES: acyl-CoA synthetase [unclassified Tsukamurella]MDF0530001.1 acyl-CoA synthetase [Tsukamurella sp. 8J]MDF0587227.1 acyl-CoA synthetase [Tsukamurella sp. 8F]